MSHASAPIRAALDDDTNETFAVLTAGELDGDITAARQIAMEEPFSRTTLLRSRIVSDDLLLH